MDGILEFENFIIGSYGGTIKENLAKKIFADMKWKEIIQKRKEVLQGINGSSF